MALAFFDLVLDDMTLSWEDDWRAWLFPFIVNPVDRKTRVEWMTIASFILYMLQQIFLTANEIQICDDTFFKNLHAAGCLAGPLNLWLCVQYSINITWQYEWSHKLQRLCMQRDWSCLCHQWRNPETIDVIIRLVNSIFWLVRFDHITIFLKSEFCHASANHNNWFSKLLMWPGNTQSFILPFNWKVSFQLSIQILLKFDLCKTPELC